MIVALNHGTAKECCCEQCEEQNDRNQSSGLRRDTE
jgi:hypothetical protein